MTEGADEEAGGDVVEEWSDAALTDPVAELEANWMRGLVGLCCMGMLGFVAGGFLVWLMVASG